MNKYSLFVFTFLMFFSLTIFQAIAEEYCYQARVLTYFRKTIDQTFCSANNDQLFRTSPRKISGDTSSWFYFKINKIRSIEKTDKTFKWANKDLFIYKVTSHSGSVVDIILTSSEGVRPHLLSESDFGNKEEYCFYNIDKRYLSREDARRTIDTIVFDANYYNIIKKRRDVLISQLQLKSLLEQQKAQKKKEQEEKQQLVKQRKAAIAQKFVGSWNAAEKYGRFFYGLRIFAKEDRVKIRYGIHQCPDIATAYVRFTDDNKGYIDCPGYRLKIYDFIGQQLRYSINGKMKTTARFLTKDPSFKPDW